MPFGNAPDIPFAFLLKKKHPIHYGNAFLFFLNT